MSLVAFPGAITLQRVCERAAVPWSSRGDRAFQISHRTGQGTVLRGDLFACHDGIAGRKLFPAKESVVGRPRIVLSASEDEFVETRCIERGRGTGVFPAD